MAKKTGNKKADKGKVQETPKPETPAPVAAGKNQMVLDSGEVIAVRGPEKYRALYLGGNVGWQDCLRAARLAINLTEYAIKVGAADSVVKKLVAEMDKAETSLTSARVRIPSDMTTRMIAIRAGLAEANVGSPDYVIALRKLASLVKVVEDANVRNEIAAEVLSAQTALKAMKS